MKSRGHPACTSTCALAAASRAPCTASPGRSSAWTGCTPSTEHSPRRAAARPGPPAGRRRPACRAVLASGEPPPKTMTLSSLHVGRPGSVARGIKCRRHDHSIRLLGYRPGGDLQDKLAVPFPRRMGPAGKGAGRLMTATISPRARRSRPWIPLVRAPALLTLRSSPTGASMSETRAAASSPSAPRS